jgi:hypothetical protein
MPTPRDRKVRQCTHIKANGVRCGSPAMKNQFFCFFHTNLIKGVPRRVDARIGSMCMLENADAIQVSIMDVMQEVRRQSIDHKRASLLIKLLHLAFRNVKNLTFEKASTRRNAVTEPPNYAAQYIVEHPEHGEPLRPIQNEELFPDGQEAQSNLASALPRASSSEKAAPLPQPAPPEALPAEPIHVPETAAATPAPLSLQANPVANPEAPSKPAQPRKILAHAASRGKSSAQHRPRSGERKPDIHPEIAELQRAVGALPDDIRRKPGQSLSEYIQASQRHKRQLSEIRRVAAALPGCLKGKLKDVKTALDFADVFPARDPGIGRGG